VVARPSAARALSGRKASARTSAASSLNATSFG
jgi:hypothetical protein